jgi:hypothetical protein
VYYEVDQGFSAPILEVITPYLLESDREKLILAAKPAVEREFNLICELFSINPGQDISKY